MKHRQHSNTGNRGQTCGIDSNTDIIGNTKVMLIINISNRDNTGNKSHTGNLEYKTTATQAMQATHRQY